MVDGSGVASLASQRRVRPACQSESTAKVLACLRSRAVAMRSSATTEVDRRRRTRTVGGESFRVGVGDEAGLEVSANVGEVVGRSNAEDDRLGDDAEVLQDCSSGLGEGVAAVVEAGRRAGAETSWGRL